MAFMTEEELADVGFKFVGKNVLLSRKASFYNAANIWIDDFARVDDFCVLSAGGGGIRIGKYVHIGCYSSLIGRDAIVLEDFSGVSGRVSIYSSDDDYSGDFMCHPTIPDGCRNVHSGSVILKKYSIIGAGTVILPEVVIGQGAAVGALSLVKNNCEEFGVYAGIPARKVKERTRELLKLREKYLPDV